MTFKDAFNKLFGSGGNSSSNLDPLDSATVPGADPPTRRVSKFPLILLLAVSASALAVIFWVAISKQDSMRPKHGNSQKSTVAQSSRGVNELLQQMNSGKSGTIEAKQEKPAQVEIIEKPSLPVKIPEPVIFNRKSETPKFSEEFLFMRKQIAQMRQQDFLQGLKSSTNAKIKTPSRNPVDQLNSIRQNRSNLSQELIKAGNDPNAIYRAKVNALQRQVADSGMNIGNPSSFGVSSQSSTSSFGGTDGNDASKYANNNWTLNQKIQNPNPYSLQTGSVITATMVSGIISDLPGQVVAQVSNDIYDSPTGKYLLIPRGTRIIGTYNSSVAYGQDRIFMAWQRLIFPDGKTLDIQAMPGADQAGYAGFEDKVNHHYFRTFSSAILLSAIIAGVELSQNDSSNSNSDKQRASDAISESLGQNLGSVMVEMVRKNLNISPTIEIRPGYKFNVIVTKDITFNEPYKNFGY